MAPDLSDVQAAISAAYFAGEIELAKTLATAHGLTDGCLACGVPTTQAVYQCIRNAIPCFRLCPNCHTGEHHIRPLKL